jgi:hypothetical protein
MMRVTRVTEEADVRNARTGFGLLRRDVTRLMAAGRHAGNAKSASFVQLARR